MKKFIYSTLLVLATSLVACTEDFTDWAQPQQNEQSATVSFGNGSVSAVGLIDFANIADNQTMVKVCNVTAPTSTDASYVAVSHILRVDNGTSFDLNNQGEIPTESLKALVETEYGKAPVERTFKALVEQWIANDATSIKTATSSEFEIKVKLVAPYISEHYYVIGAPSEWNPTCTTLPFTHSDAGVYDDPYFTAVFTVQPGETWFAITDDKTVASGEWSDVLGCAEGNGNNGEEGLIARRSELSDDGSWKIVAEQESTVKLTINMMDYSYKIEIIPMSSFYYVVGGVQGWSDKNRTHVFFPGAEPKVYSYTTKWTGAWDLKIWSEADFGNWDNAMGSVVDGSTDTEGPLAFSGAGAISAPSAEYYTFTINMSTNTYSWTKLADQNPTEYEVISLIGDFNGWGGDIDLQKVCDHNWFVETEIPSTGGLKFRANHDWAVNWGVDMDIYTQNFAVGEGNGPNIAVPAGTYRFYLNDITGDLAIVPVGEMPEPEPSDWSEYVWLPGEANGWGDNGWDVVDRLLGNGNGKYTGFAVVGGTWGWKITTADNWSNAYGNGGEGVIAAGGGNIMEGSVATPCWVEVNLADLTYNVTEVTAMSLIGSITDASWGIDTDMTWDAATKTWSVTADLAAGDFKIRMNHDWTISLGGSFDSMTTQNGANMQIAEAGNYTITLYPSYDGASHCTVVKN